MLENSYNMLGNIYEAKPRYDLLDELLENYNTNLKFTNNINIIVDLKQVYRKIFRSSYVLENTQNAFLAMEAQRITSDIIGIIGHYRNYFYKKSKYTTFYFLYSESECDVLQQLNNEYKKDYYSKYMNSIEDADKILLLKRCTKALNTVLNMLPNCYFIDTSKFDEYLFARNIIDRSNKNELNIILSNDENMFQLVRDNSILLNISGLDTAIIDKKSIFKYFNIDSSLHPSLYSYVLSIAGNKKYSISGIKGFSFKKATQFITELVADKKIQNTEYINFVITENMLNDTKAHKAIVENFERFKQNYQLFTLNQLYYENISKFDAYFIKKQRIYTTQEFESLNNKIFTNYPLDLFKILRGEL